MADAKHLLEFLEGGIGMLFDLGLEFLRVEFAPVSPAGFRGQRAGFGGVQIPINGTPGQVEPPGGLGFGAARFDEVHHPFPQVQRICFHALKPITLCPNVNVKCYSEIIVNSHGIVNAEIAEITYNGSSSISSSYTDKFVRIALAKVKRCYAWSCEDKTE